jgi:ABC-type sugar transport system, periplasmic component
MKKMLFFLLIISLVLGLTGCKEKRDITIAIISKGYQQEFWRTVELGARKAAAESNVKITFVGPDKETDIAGQVNMVHEAVNQKVSAIVLAALDSQLLLPVVEKAHSNNIPVITFDSNIEGNIPLSFAATDNVVASTTAGKEMAKLMNENGKVAIVSHLAGTQSAIYREKGFKDEISKHPQMQIINTYYSDGDRKKAEAITKDIIASNPDISAIYATCEGAAVGVADAIKEEGKTGKISIVGFDSSEDEIKYINDGVINGTVIQNPYQMGYISVKKALSAIKGENVEKRIDTGVTYVNKSNINTTDVNKLIHPLNNS